MTANKKYKTVKYPTVPIRLYRAWERANICYKLVFGLVPPDRFDADDSEEACEEAVSYFIEHLYRVPNTNPIRKSFKTEVEFTEWFDTVYPKVENATKWFTNTFEDGQEILKCLSELLDSTVLKHFYEDGFSTAAYVIYDCTVTDNRYVWITVVNLKPFTYTTLAFGMDTIQSFLVAMSSTHLEVCPWIPKTE